MLVLPGRKECGVLKNMRTSIRNTMAHFATNFHIKTLFLKSIAQEFSFLEILIKKELMKSNEQTEYNKKTCKIHIFLLVWFTKIHPVTLFLIGF